MKNPIEYIEARPLDTNILEWHFVITGNQDPYTGGPLSKLELTQPTERQELFSSTVNLPNLRAWSAYLLEAARPVSRQRSVLRHRDRHEADVREAQKDLIKQD